MGSPRFRLNQTDLQKIGSLSLTAGSSAAVIALLEYLLTADFGRWDMLMTVVLSSAIEALRRWAADTRLPLRDERDAA